MDDHFRPVPNYPGYRINRLGEVQSRWLRAGRHSRLTDTWRALSPFPRDDYPSVNLTRGGKKTACKVHRLVLEAFVGLCPDGLVCCHGDGDRANCSLTNLRWDTPQANSDDARRHGTMAIGSRCNSKLAEHDVLAIRRLRAEGVPAKELAGRYGVTTRNIWAIVSGKLWKHLPSAPDQASDPQGAARASVDGDCEAA
jgi:hypothetical protein